jgi:hypothetical protein
MDGSRSLEEIVALAARLHPGVAPEILRQAVSQLHDSGYVEDAGAPDPPVLTGRDKERYDRARRYYRWLDLIPRASTWEPQARLAAARVTVLGVGGNGGVAALALAAAGVGRMHCVDPDVVELSNLSRQVLYTEADIGAPKVAAAVARLQAVNSDIVITGERLRVGSAQDAACLARECDVLLMAADEPADVRPSLGQPRLHCRWQAVGRRRLLRTPGPGRRLRSWRGRMLGMPARTTSANRSWNSASPPMTPGTSSTSHRACEAP